mmetsp:Transcript_67009/g.188722  ORF Transcript_67009/g.188722 Transcript_67009/m.188722 type:complete len:233 (+) Transcript_67009:655-1353(+)
MGRQRRWSAASRGSSKVPSRPVWRGRARLPSRKERGSWTPAAPSASGTPARWAARPATPRRRARPRGSGRASTTTRPVTCAWVVTPSVARQGTVNTIFQWGTSSCTTALTSRPTGSAPSSVRLVTSARGWLSSVMPTGRSRTPALPARSSSAHPAARPEPACSARAAGLSVPRASPPARQVTSATRRSGGAPWTNPTRAFRCKAPRPGVRPTPATRTCQRASGSSTTAWAWQ